MIGTPESIAVRADDGWTLYGDLHLPTGPPVGAAVLGHAMWVDRRTMDRPRGEGLASVLRDAGLAVISFDMRGHGESGPLPREGARHGYDEYVLWDVPAIVREARRRFPDLPVTLVGHSLTGHTGLIAAGLFPDLAPDAVVALAVNVWLPRLEATWRSRLGKAAALLGWAAVTAPVGHFDARRFGMGSSGVPWAYVRHYLTSYFTDRLESQDGRRLDYLEALGRVELPILSVASEGDGWMASVASVDAFLSTMPRAEITRRVVTAAELDPPPDHMGLVIDPRCRVLWEEIAAWVTARS